MPKPEEVQKKKFLPKPEKVPTKTTTKKKDFQPLAGPRPEDRKIVLLFVFVWYPFRFWQFWFCFFGTSPGFGNKIVPKPEEVPTTIININILFDTTPFQLPIPVLDFRALLKEDKLESKASSSMKRAKKHCIYSVFCSYSGHL